MASFHLWCAALFGLESAKSYLSNVEFLPFLHKFNTFTFYTPYLLFLDQLQNEGKRVFSIRFQNQYIRGVYCQYPIFICFSTNFRPKGKRQCIRRVTPIFFDQLETHRIELIFLYFCKLIKITYSHALYIINHDSFIIFCRECFFIFIHYCFYLMIFRYNQILFYNFIFIGN